MSRIERLRKLQRGGPCDEISLLKRFFERLNLPLEDENITKGEAPDFMVSIGTKRTRLKTACELTRVFQDASENGSLGARAVSEWNRFRVRFEEELCTEKIGIRGTLDFLAGPLTIDETGIDNHRAAQTALIGFVGDRAAQTQFKDLVVRCAADIAGVTVVEPAFGSALSKYVHAVRLMPATPEDSVWWASHLQSGPLPDPWDAIRNTVTKKAITAKKYNHDGAKELWLIIVADGLQLETTCIIRPEALQALPTSIAPIDRVWFWDGFCEEIWQLFPEAGLVYRYEQGRDVVYHSLLPHWLRDETDQP